MSQLGGGLLEPHLLLGTEERSCRQQQFACGGYACTWAAWGLQGAARTVCHHTNSCSVRMTGSSLRNLPPARTCAMTHLWLCLTRFACFLLAVLQTFKNALTTLPMGGGKVSQGMHITALACVSQLVP
jgi:hypothetical protein